MPPKIDPAKIAMIREEYRTSIAELSLRRLAEKYGVGHTTLRAYSAREGWVDLRKAYLAQLSQERSDAARIRSKEAMKQVLSDHEKAAKTLRGARDRLARMVLMKAEELDSMWYGLTPAEKAKLYPAYCKALGELAKIVELFDGGATERVEVQGEPIQLSRDEAEVWARLRSRLWERVKN